MKFPSTMTTFHAWRSSVLGLALAMLAAPMANGQQGEPPLRVGGFMASGVRTSVTEGWGKLDFILTNASDKDRKARVVAFYENRPDAHYCRDLWVPARSTLASWLPLGPAPPQAHTGARELRFLLHDLTEGKNSLLLPTTEERIRSASVMYRARETTTVLVAEDLTKPPVPGQLPQPESPADEAYTMTRIVRGARSLSAMVQVLEPGSLAPWPKAFDGIDHLILAAARVGQDPAGMRALRQWLAQGGQVWVMLDRVDPEAIAPLLGEALDFQVVDRVSLTDFRIIDQLAEVEAPLMQQADSQRHDRPVEFVHVLLPPGKRSSDVVRYTIDGWPVWFTRPVGRGKVLFTTLGPRGWYRTRTPRDGRSPFADHPELPVATEALATFADELAARPGEPPYPIEAFEGLLTEEIGYSVLNRWAIASIFALFLAGTLGLSMVARRSRRPEWLGWIGPAAALAFAAVIFVLGDFTRRSVPPTIAAAQFVLASPGNNEIAVQGMLGVYRPDSGPADLGAVDGGFFDLDMAGLEGQTRRLVLTDVGDWHWDNLMLPAGVRFAPFQFTTRTTEPIQAIARFGPDGLEGKLASGPLKNLADGLLTSPGARNLAIRLRQGGSFSATTEDALTAGHFIAGTILSDRQQRRQEIYRAMLKRPEGGRPEGGRPEGAPTDDRHLLWAWADPLPVPFHLTAESRFIGAALLSVPLGFEQTPPQTRVTIPGAFVKIRRVIDDKTTRVVYELAQGADMLLRFQLPTAVLPLEVERARLTVKMAASARRVTVAAPVDGTLIELFKTENPLGPFQVEIAQERFLRLDKDGGLRLNLTISDRLAQAQAAAEQTWTIEYIELEVVGRTR